MTGRIETGKTALHQSYFYVSWSTSQNTSTALTTVNWEIHLNTPNESWYSNAVRIDYLKINNVTVKGSETFSNISHTDRKLAEGSSIFNHDSDGYLTLSFSFKGWLYIDGTFTASGSQAQPRIILCSPATISSVTPSVDFGSNCIINVTPSDKANEQGCTYKLEWICNNNSGVISTEKDTSYTFITNNFNLIKGVISLDITCTIRLTTYWNNSPIGTSLNTFTIAIPLAVSNFSISGTDGQREFDTSYTVSFDASCVVEVESVNIDYYTYKLVGGGLNQTVRSGDSFLISSSQCPNANLDNITLQLITYTGDTPFDNPPSLSVLFNVPNTEDYEPSISVDTIAYNKMYNGQYYFNDDNGSHQSSIDITFTDLDPGTGSSIDEITTSESNIVVNSIDVNNKKVNISLSGNISTGNITFTLTDARGRTGSTNVLFPNITVLSYVPLRLYNVESHNEYKGYDNLNGFYISYSLEYTSGGLSPSVTGSMLLGDDLTPITLSGNPLLPPDSYTGSPLSKNITITASLYGESVTVPLYIAPLDRAINLNKNNKKICIGGFAGEYRASFELLTSEPDDWSTNYTGYYTKNNDEYIKIPLLSPAPTFQTNTYYKDTTSTDWIDTWGLIIGNFDLTLTDAELTALKNKFNI